MRLISRICLLAFVLALALNLRSTPTALHANSGVPSEIVFLTLEVSDGGVKLLEWWTVPGSLKPSRAPVANDGIRYHALSAGGRSLWSEMIEDPRLVRVEVADSAGSGNLAGEAFSRDTAVFTIRIPARGDIDHLDFFVRREGSRSDYAASATRPLGTVERPTTREGKAE